MDKSTKPKTLLDGFGEATEEVVSLRAENEQLRAALTEITELDLEGDASLGDALAIADEALNPSPA